MSSNRAMYNNHNRCFQHPIFPQNKLVFFRLIYSVFTMHVCTCAAQAMRLEWAKKDYTACLREKFMEKIHEPVFDGAEQKREIRTNDRRVWGARN